MRIESITLRKLKMRLKSPFETSFGTTHDRTVVLVEVLADGLTGWSEVTSWEGDRLRRGNSAYFVGHSGSRDGPRGDRKRSLGCRGAGKEPLTRSLARRHAIRHQMRCLF